MRVLPLLLVTAFGCTASADETRPNVLFIAVDDLRPELGCYGNRRVKTPHVDRLAKQGLLFRRAYCQQAACNPSRASLLTGLRPETLGVHDLSTHFRDRKPDAVTIAQHFKAHGYFTDRVGKIFHTGHGNRDDARSWSRRVKRKRKPRYGPQGRKLLADLQAEARRAGVDLSQRRNQPRGLPWEAPDVDDGELADGSIAEHAVRILREVQDRPFFLAVGFLNPHLPFVAPRKYWALYDPHEIELAGHDEPPRDAPGFAGTNWGELRRYHGVPRRGPLSEEQARTMIRGYRAATSYVDALVGRLLDELERLELRQRTVVVLWGDHGWQLGEHGYWCKHTNYEAAVRVPLILSVPGQDHAGSRTDAVVELVDVFPTLAELCGLPVPEGLDGLSLKPLLEDPGRRWKTAAFHLYPRPIPGRGRGMGRAIRTDRYRLVEWTVPDSKFVAYELYDYRNDPHERVNLARSPAYRPTLEVLLNRLKAGPQAARPD